MNTKKFGNIGLGKAINYFLSCGYIVSLPINDSQSYDLIVEINNNLYKIQVKMTGQKKKNNIFLVDLRSTGGNRSRNTAKLFDKKSCDYIFACTSENETFLIPSEICNKNSICLGDKFKKFSVTIATTHSL